MRKNKTVPTPPPKPYMCALHIEKYMYIKKIFAGKEKLITKL